MGIFYTRVRATVNSRIIAGVDERRKKDETEFLVPLAAALLDRLGRPGDIRLGLPPRDGHPTLPTGIAALDHVLGGGLPRGRLIELAGHRSTGRTGLACTIAARATRHGEIVGWIDSTDALDPETVVTTGIAPTLVLWVRPRTEHDAPKAAEYLLGAGGFGLVVLDLAEAAPHLHISWPRLTRAAERTRTTLLVLAPERRAGSYAALGLELSERRAHWSRKTGRPAMLDGITAALTVARNRLGVSGRSLTVRHACA